MEGKRQVTTMRSIHENHGKASIAAVVLAAMAIVAVVSPVYGAPGKPPDECPQQPQELVAAISPEMQARIIIEKQELQVAVAERLAEVVERDIAWSDQVRVDGLRELALLDRYEVLDRYEALDRYEVLDRYVDMVEPTEWKHEWHAFIRGDEKPSKASHPLAAAIDILVSGAKLPARGALAAQHVVEAFAKVTPRVVRALF